jgi:hypothetical protein
MPMAAVFSALLPTSRAPVPGVLEEKWRFLKNAKSGQKAFQFRPLGDPFGFFPEIPEIPDVCRSGAKTRQRVRSRRRWSRHANVAARLHNPEPWQTPIMVLTAGGAER